MIRSRDLVIFVAMLLVLFIAIGLTVFKDQWNFSQSASKPFGISTSSTPQTYSAVSDSKTLNREQNIARLREALAKNEVLVEPSPSVESSVPPAPTSTESTATQDQTNGISTCGGEDSSKYIHGWPLAGVVIKEVAGLRTVVVETPTTVQVSTSGTTSSSTVNTEEKILLETPIMPQALSNSHCVPSDAIGVTVTGSLIFNSDASFYRGYGKDYLIGYARDGYPIYGYYDGAVDACGGYSSASGYRYTVSPGRNFIIGCFTAQPSPFVGL